MTLSVNEQMLLKVAEGLPPELRNQVVFIGGSVVSLLITETAFGGIRPTKDVDLIIETSNRSGFHRFEESLRKAGFHQILDDDPPIICRWRINSVVVDVMPCDAAILGFSNKWYKASVKNYNIINLEGTEIKVVNAPYFLATKVEAFLGRGNNDFMGSHDLEDIITILDGRSEIVAEIKAAETKLQAYLGKIFQIWLQNRDFRNALPGMLAPDSASQARLQIVISRLTEVSQM
ncbi:MAG: nucleotidyl transferase AbiEii/AbiGii toxin family protein [Candidatus Riflebacteria bacterium]|nr:nucleotidyl transferase AbiEii/AbiGii toxin family protein [Candidatus Riflebacteria bacterium]